MPAGEEMFKYHGYSGNCPKPPMASEQIRVELEKEQARHQTCSKGHKYYADSHEFPCPWCVNAKADLALEQAKLTNVRIV